MPTLKDNSRYLYNTEHFMQLLKEFIFHFKSLLLGVLQMFLFVPTTPFHLASALPQSSPHYCLCP